MHVNSEGFKNFTSLPAHCKADFTGPTGNQLSADQRTSVNFHPCKLKAAQNNSVNTAMHVSFKISNKHPSLYLYV